MKTTLFTTTAFVILFTTNAFAFVQNQDQQQKQELINNNRPSAESGASTDGSISNDEGNSFNYAPTYNEGSLPPSPVLSPGGVAVPQMSEGYKILGPVWTSTYTGPSADCARGNAWTAMLLRRQMLVDVASLYKTGLDPYVVKYSAAVEAAVGECSK